jgi:hypothetical protein
MVFTDKVSGIVKRYVVWGQEVSEHDLLIGTTGVPAGAQCAVVTELPPDCNKVRCKKELEEK